MKVSEEIIDVLEYLGEKFGVAIDRSSDTLLPVLQNLGHKYIRWEIATSIAWLVIGVIFFNCWIYFITEGSCRTRKIYKR